MPDDVGADQLRCATFGINGERSHLGVGNQPAAIDLGQVGAAQHRTPIVAAHPVDDIHVEEPLIEEVIARFYDLHGAADS